MASLGESSDAPVIRIVKKKGGGGGHHGGAWKVAYADFVTAMMAFFLVMWIVGLDKPTREAIAYYFNHPGLFTTGSGNKGPGTTPSPSVGKPIPLEPGKGSKEAVEAQFKEAANA